MSVNQRIKIFQEVSFPKQRDFANLIDISEKTLSSIYTGKTKPSFMVIEAILKGFPKLNARWLLIGDGEMFNNSDNSELLEINEPFTPYGKIHTTEGVLERMERRITELEKTIEKLSTEK